MVAEWVAFRVRRHPGTATPQQLNGRRRVFLLGPLTQFINGRPDCVHGAVYIGSAADKMKPEIKLPRLTIMGSRDPLTLGKVSFRADVHDQAGSRRSVVDGPWELGDSSYSSSLVKVPCDPSNPWQVLRSFFTPPTCLDTTRPFPTDRKCKQGLIFVWWREAITRASHATRPKPLSGRWVRRSHQQGLLHE